MTKEILILLAVLCIGTTELRAQQDADAAGGDATGSGGSASFSIGQVAYTYLSGTDGTSNQGVQQPYEFFITGIDENKSITLTMTAFPNPTQTIVHLKIESESLENFNYRLTDIGGRVITVASINSSLTVIHMEGLASGAYALAVSGSGETLKTFTIIKYN